MTERVLIVDDDPVMTEILDEVLEAAGYEVLSASSGEEAMELMERSAHLPSLVLLDLVLPGISGAEVLEGMRRTPRLSGVRVLVVSGASRLRDLTAQLHVDALPKPFGMDELLDAVASHGPHDAQPSAP